MFIRILYILCMTIRIYELLKRRIRSACTAATTTPWADDPEWVPGGRQNQISGHPGHRRRKKNGWKKKRKKSYRTPTTIFYILYRIPTPLRYYYYFFSFSDLASAARVYRLTPPGQGCKFLYRYNIHEY